MRKGTNMDLFRRFLPSLRNNNEDSTNTEILESDVKKLNVNVERNPELKGMLENPLEAIEKNEKLRNAIAAKGKQMGWNLFQTTNEKSTGSVSDDYEKKDPTTDLGRISLGAKIQIRPLTNTTNVVNILMFGKSGCGQTTLLSYLTSNDQLIGDDSMSTQQFHADTIEAQCDTGMTKTRINESPGMCSGFEIAELEQHWNKLIARVNGKGGVSVFLLLIKSNERITSQFIDELEEFSELYFEDKDEFWKRTIVVFTTIDELKGCNTFEGRVDKLETQITKPGMEKVKEILDRTRTKRVYVSSIDQMGRNRLFNDLNDRVFSISSTFVQIFPSNLPIDEENDKNSSEAEMDEQTKSVDNDTKSQSINRTSGNRQSIAHNKKQESKPSNSRERNTCILSEQTSTKEYRNSSEVYYNQNTLGTPPKRENSIENQKNPPNSEEITKIDNKEEYASETASSNDISKIQSEQQSMDSAAQHKGATNASSSKVPFKVRRLSSTEYEASTPPKVCQDEKMPLLTTQPIDNKNISQEVASPKQTSKEPAHLRDHTSHKQHDQGAKDASTYHYKQLIGSAEYKQYTPITSEHSNTISHDRDNCTPTEREATSPQIADQNMKLPMKSRIMQQDKEKVVSGQISPTNESNDNPIREHQSTSSILVGSNDKHIETITTTFNFNLIREKFENPNQNKCTHLNTDNKLGEILARRETTDSTNMNKPSMNNFEPMDKENNLTEFVEKFSLDDLQTVIKEACEEDRNTKQLLIKLLQRRRHQSDEETLDSTGDITGL